MATTKPRVQVTLPESTHAVIKEHCKLTGVSMSAFICAAMVQAEEGLKALNGVLSVADQMTDEAKSEFLNSMFGMFTDSGELDSPEPAIAGVAPAASDAASGEANPLSINKGVRSIRSKSNIAKNGSKNIYLASDSTKTTRGGA